MRREVLATPDGDDLVVDHVDAADPASPRVVFLHGLEGSSYSVYMQGMMALAAARGWASTAVNFRSCARPPEDITRMLPNKRPRMYHSGETTDMDFVFRTMKAREPERRLAAVGVSLGGNAMLKWLGEHPNEPNLVSAAVSISVPYDLGAGSKHLETPIGRFYLANFLKTLIPKAVRCAERFPEAAARIDVEGTRRSTTFWTFDDYATGPLHGFKDARDYYTRCSSIHFVGRIAVPTLCISAADDPFLPRRVLGEVADAKSSAVTLLVTPGGGHVGFIGGPRPSRARYWAEETAIGFLATAI